MRGRGMMLGSKSSKVQRLQQTVRGRCTIRGRGDDVGATCYGTHVTEAVAAIHASRIHRDARHAHGKKLRHARRRWTTCRGGAAPARDDAFGRDTRLQNFDLGGLPCACKNARPEAVPAAQCCGRSRTRRRILR